MADDLTARLLAEIERREGDANQPSRFGGVLAPEAADYLAALRKVVELHHPWRYTPQSGEECATCGPGKRWPCPTMEAVAEAIGVEP